MAKLIFLYRIFRLYLYCEAGEPHHEPHVNVRMRNGRTGNLSIKTGQVLNGNLTNKEIRVVQAFMEENRDEVMARWNKIYNGVPFEPMEDIE